MIEHNSKRMDAADIVALITAVGIYGALNYERLGKSMRDVGLARLFYRCQTAAAMIAHQHTDEGSKWDPTWWYDRISDVTDGGLAAQIYKMNCEISDLQAHRANSAPLRRIVRSWLMHIGNCEVGTWNVERDMKREKSQRVGSKDPTNTVKPCHCGFEGNLTVMSDQGWFEVKCPSCRRRVEAFTAEGLIEAWNKPAVNSQQ